MGFEFSMSSSGIIKATINGQSAGTIFDSEYDENYKIYTKGEDLFMKLKLKKVIQQKGFILFISI